MTKGRLPTPFPGCRRSQGGERQVVHHNARVTRERSTVMSTVSNFHPLKLRRRRSQQRGAVGRACWEVLEDRRLLSFAPAVDYAGGPNPQEIIAADFNNDGRLDLVVANPTANSVNALLGNGNGTFESPKSSAAGDNPSSIA